MIPTWNSIGLIKPKNKNGQKCKRIELESLNMNSIWNQAAKLKINRSLGSFIVQFCSIKSLDDAHVYVSFMWNKTIVYNAYSKCFQYIIQI